MLLLFLIYFIVYQTNIMYLYRQALEAGMAVKVMEKGTRRNTAARVPTGASGQVNSTHSSRRTNSLTPPPGHALPVCTRVRGLICI